MEVRDLSDCLLAVAQRVVTGGPGPTIGRALAAARLIALPKGDRDVRPIAVGEVFRRLVARSICLQEKATMADILSPMQYGVAVPGGLDQIVHQIQAGLEAHDDWGLFKCDLQNAFNSVSREAFFRETSCHLHLSCPLPAFSMVSHLPLSIRAVTPLLKSCHVRVFIKVIPWAPSTSVLPSTLFSSLCPSLTRIYWFLLFLMMSTC